MPQDQSGANREPLILDSVDTSAFDAAFGRRVRELREAAGLTQRQLASQMTAAGHTMHQTTIAKIEAGQRPVLVKESSALAGVLGVSQADMMPGPDGPDDPIARVRIWALERLIAEHELAASTASATAADLRRQLDDFRASLTPPERIRPG